MSLATLNGHTVSRARVQVGSFGCWYADVDLVEDKELSGAVELKIADVTASCTVVSGGAHDGRAAYRLVGGAGGWGRTLPRKGYMNDAGVKLASMTLAGVVGDAAVSVGETLADVPTTRLGAHFAREEGPASKLLNALAPRNWYVGFDGVTRFGTRPPSTYSGDGVRTRVDKAMGVIELATEEIATLVPGVSVDGSPPASDVEYELEPGRLTVRLYTSPSGQSRRLAAWRAIFDALDPWRRYRGFFEYRVVTQEGERLNIQPVRSADGLPDLERVPVRFAPGFKAAHMLGSLVIVAFVGGDPSRPCVVAGEEAGGPGFVPLSLDLGGTPATPVSLAPLTDAQFNALKTTINSWVVVPQDGGLALKTALETLFATWPASTAATIVKAN